MHNARHPSTFDETRRRSLSTAMSGETIEIVAPSRLHFGMFAFGRSAERQFGGVGTMVDRPGLKLRISPSRTFEVCGSLEARVRHVVERLTRVLELDVLPNLRIEIADAPPEHVGLGTGTQLAHAVIAGFQAMRGDVALDAPALAALSGRAARSAIGTYGFAQGGLLVEAGKHDDEQLSPLVARVELPEAWRWVLICPQDQRGLSGDAEQRAFRDLPPVERATTGRLLSIVHDEMLPAAAAGRFAEFGESVYRYGFEAGMCFATRQGGPFASQRIAELVNSIRAMGVAGVGQSSWGPTVFALFEGETEAQRFCHRVEADAAHGCTLLVAATDNAGAQIRRCES